MDKKEIKREIAIKQFDDGKWYLTICGWPVSIDFLKMMGANGLGKFIRIRRSKGHISRFPYFDSMKDAEYFKEWADSLFLAYIIEGHWSALLPVSGKKYYNPWANVWVNGIQLKPDKDYFAEDKKVYFIGNIIPGKRDIVCIQWQEIKNGDFVINEEYLTY